MLVDRGSWEGHRWDQIVGYTELELFRLCFPEEYVERVILPTMNASLRKPCTLGYGVLPGDCGLTSVVVKGAGVDVRGGPVPALPRLVHDTLP